MALQFRSLFAMSCLHRSFSSRTRLPSPTLQYQASARNFPCGCGLNLHLGSGKMYRKPYQHKISNGTACSLYSQLGNSGFCSARYQGNPVSRVGDKFGFTLLTSELTGNRFFSTKTKKKFRGRAKPVEIGDGVATGEKKSGDGNSAAGILHLLAKREESPAACGSVNGQVNAAVSKPSRKSTAKRSKSASTAVDAKEKTKSSGKTQDAKTPVKKVEKPAGKKEGNELFGGSMPSSAATVQPKGQEKSSKRRGPVEKSPVRVNDKSQSSLVEGAKSWSGQLKPLYPPSGKSVMVVESATKAKVIQNYLGDMFEVIPSYGHVRDLARKSRSVRPDDNFSMVWEVPATAWTHLKSIKVALRGANNLILASDPDREGEAIAWHIIEMLQQQDALSQNITVARVVFHEITNSSIKSALQAPREIDKNLVNAYLARRALDYLIGFSISPLLWRKLPSCSSAGRVQSAALALICDREIEVEHFNQREYWTVGVDFHVSCSDSLEKRIYISSQLTHFDSKKLDQLSICSDEEAKAIEKQIHSSKFEIIDLKTSRVHKNPPMPYITSTLQQDSANKLHFTAANTMKLAQKLYEGVNLSDKEATGLITYMRTDGLHVSNEAAESICSFIKERFGKEFAPKIARKYFRKVKNAQEAHEAIRPTDIRRLPSTLVGLLDDDSLRLYTLIWTRTMACQMEPVATDMIQVGIANTEGDMILRSVGSRVSFPGYEAVYQDREAAISGSNETDGSACGTSYENLYKLKVRDGMSLGKVELKQHFTKPPARYSEGALVKKLEELGIGRPSTYASIIKVLQERKYVMTKSRVLHPDFRGRMVSAFLSHHFSEVVDYSFTADMENELDNVSAGVTEWKGLVQDYWSRFSKCCELTKNVEIRQIEKMLEKRFRHILFDSLPSTSRICPRCMKGTLRFKISKIGNGYFIGCDEHPRCKYIVGNVDETVPDDKLDNSFQPRLLGHIPGSNEKVLLKRGPYGHYVQLGDGGKHSAKRASLSQCLPTDVKYPIVPLVLSGSIRRILEVKDIDSLTLEDAIELLQYPVTLGNHPDDEHPVLLTHSKFGYYIKHRRTTAPVPKNKNPKSITLEAGLKLLLSKNVRRSGRPKTKPKTEEETFLE